jgi:hypothetical protein
VVFCTAVKHGTQIEYDFLKKKYSHVSDMQTKQEILFSLTCGKQITDLSRIFEKELEMNNLGMIRSVLMTSSNDYKSVNLMAWNSIKKIWPKLSKFIHKFFFDSNFILKLIF